MISLNQLERATDAVAATYADMLGEHFTREASADDRRIAKAALEAALPLIDDEDEFLALPAGTIVYSAVGSIACKYDDHRGCAFGTKQLFRWADLALPVRVLWAGAL